MSFIKTPGSIKLPLYDLNNMRDPQAVVEIASDCLQNMMKDE